MTIARETVQRTVRDTPFVDHECTHSITLPPGPGANDYTERDIAYPVLEAAGFGQCRRKVVASGWEADDPGAPFDFF